VINSTSHAIETPRRNNERKLIFIDDSEEFKHRRSIKLHQTLDEVRERFRNTEQILENESIDLRPHRPSPLLQTRRVLNMTGSEVSGFRDDLDLTRTFLTASVAKPTTPSSTEVRWL
jgi:hypothetical protein